MFTVNSKFNWYKAITSRLQTIRKGQKKTLPVSGNVLLVSKFETIISSDL
jgi:hypothetical protein